MWKLYISLISASVLKLSLVLRLHCEVILCRAALQPSKMMKQGRKTKIRVIWLFFFWAKTWDVKILNLDNMAKRACVGQNQKCSVTSARLCAKNSTVLEISSHSTFSFAWATCRELFFAQFKPAQNIHHLCPLCYIFHSSVSCLICLSKSRSEVVDHLEWVSCAIMLVVGDVYCRCWGKSPKVGGP